MNKAEQNILTEIALTGQATILLNKPHEARAVETMKCLRIIHVEAGNEQVCIVKFGVAPSGHKQREI